MGVSNTTWFFLGPCGLPRFFLVNRRFVRLGVFSVFPRRLPKRRTGEARVLERGAVFGFGGGRAGPGLLGVVGGGAARHASAPAGAGPGPLSRVGDGCGFLRGAAPRVFFFFRKGRRGGAGWRGVLACVGGFGRALEGNGRFNPHCFPTAGRRLSLSGSEKAVFPNELFLFSICPSRRLAVLPLSRSSGWPARLWRGLGVVHGLTRPPLAAAERSGGCPYPDHQRRAPDRKAWGLGKGKRKRVRGGEGSGRCGRAGLANLFVLARIGFSA